MTKNKFALGVLLVISLAFAAGAVTGQTAGTDLVTTREAPTLVLERSGMTTLLGEARLGEAGLTGSLGLGFDRQPMTLASRGEPASTERESMIEESIAAAPADVALPSAFAFDRVTPNPTNLSALLSFDLPTTSRVRIEAYDVRGRKVNAQSEELGPGRFQREWQAVDESGRTLSPGFYLVRIEASAVSGGQGFSAVRRILVLH